MYFNSKVRYINRIVNLLGRLKCHWSGKDFYSLLQHLTGWKDSLGISLNDQNRCFQKKDYLIFNLPWRKHWQHRLYRCLVTSPNFEGRTPICRETLPLMPKKLMMAVLDIRREALSCGTTFLCSKLNNSLHVGALRILSIVCWWFWFQTLFFSVKIHIWWCTNSPTWP